MSAARSCFDSFKSTVRQSYPVANVDSGWPGLYQSTTQPQFGLISYCEIPVDSGLGKKRERRLSCVQFWLSEVLNPQVGEGCRPAVAVSSLESIHTIGELNRLLKFTRKTDFKSRRCDFGMLLLRLGVDNKVVTKLGGLGNHVVWHNSNRGRLRNWLCGFVRRTGLGGIFIGISMNRGSVKNSWVKNGVRQWALTATRNFGV